MLIEKLGSILKKEPDQTIITLKNYLDSAGFANTMEQQIDNFGKTARVRTLVEKGQLLERSEVFRVSKDGKIESIFEGHFPVDYRDWGTVLLPNHPLISTLTLC